MYCPACASGSAAYHCARLLHDDGYTIVGASDSKSAIFDPDGFDPKAVLDHKRKEGSLEGAPTKGTSEALSQDALIACDCDILVPAALSNQIDKDNADSVTAKTVLEIANSPVTPEAHDILTDKGVSVVPDILTNAGGVIVSYFEWTQNRTGSYWSEREVHEALDEQIGAAADRVGEEADRSDTDLRTAAYILALRRICGALSEYGTEEFFES